MNLWQLMRLRAALRISDDERLRDYVFDINGLDWFVFNACTAWCCLGEEMCRLMPWELRLFMQFVEHAESDALEVTR